MSRGRSAPRLASAGAASVSAGALSFSLTRSVAAVAILGPSSTAAMLALPRRRSRSCRCRACCRSACRLPRRAGTWNWRLLLLRRSVGSAAASSVVGMIREWIRLCRLQKENPNKLRGEPNERMPAEDSTIQFQYRKASKPTQEKHGWRNFSLQAKFPDKISPKSERKQLVSIRMTNTMRKCM